MKGIYFGRPSPHILSNLKENNIYHLTVYLDQSRQNPFGVVLI